jgi:hypothetical protein
MHGLRATAVVGLRRAGAEITRIADCVSMLEGMAGHYCKLSDQRDNTRAAVNSSRSDARCVPAKSVKIQSCDTLGQYLTVRMHPLDHIAATAP